MTGPETKPANPERSQARRFLVSGRVQGVGYRWFAVLAANRLGIHGYARNLADGRVEVYALGPPEQLAALRAELETGPRASRVTGVHEVPAAFEPRYAEEFSVEHDS